MNIKELREEVLGVERWSMNEEEIRYASPEAKSVAGVLRNAVRERDARLAATAQAARQTAQSWPETQRRRATTREVFISPAAVRQQEPVVPQQIVVPPAPAPVPGSARHPHHHHHQQQQSGRNSSLRLVLQKVAAPFTSSSHSHIHSRKTSTATGITAISTSSSSSSSSLNSPMPLTPPGSSYNSAVDVSSAYHHQQQQSGYGQAWRGSSGTPPPPGLTMGLGKKEWLYQHEQVLLPQTQVVGGARR